MAARIVQNTGIGVDELTFDNLSTTVAGTLSRPITQADLDAGRDAVGIFANRQVGIGTTTHALFGKAVAVSEDLHAKGHPLRVTVQVSGAMQLNGTTTLPTFANYISARGGKVSACTGTSAIHVFGAKRIARVCDVWNTDMIEVVL